LCPGFRREARKPVVRTVTKMAKSLDECTLIWYIIVRSREGFMVRPVPPAGSHSLRAFLEPHGGARHCHFSRFLPGKTGKVYARANVAMASPAQPVLDQAAGDRIAAWQAEAVALGMGEERASLEPGGVLQLLGIDGDRA